MPNEKEQEKLRSRESRLLTRVRCPYCGEELPRVVLEEDVPRETGGPPMAAGGGGAVTRASRVGSEAGARLAGAPDSDREALEQARAELGARTVVRRVTAEEEQREKAARAERTRLAKLKAESRRNRATRRPRGRR